MNKMKALTKILALALPVAFAVSCRPDQPTDPGTAYGAGEGVVGTWRQSGATVYDMSLAVPEAMDLTGFYTKDDNSWIVSFSDDGTYSVDQMGAGPSPFAANGTYVFDTIHYPTAMTVVGDTTTEVQMLNAPRENDVTFGISYEVEKCDEVVAKYELIFTREQ